MTFSSQTENVRIHGLSRVQEGLEGPLGREVRKSQTGALAVGRCALRSYQESPEGRPRRVPGGVTNPVATLPMERRDFPRQTVPCLACLTNCPGGGGRVAQSSVGLWDLNKRVTLLFSISSLLLAPFKKSEQPWFLY